MSGGEFQDKDRIARLIISESLNEAIERSKDDDSFHRNAKLMKSVSSIYFQWLHDYDLAASGDTSFNTLDKQVHSHIEQLQVALNNARSDHS